MYLFATKRHGVPAKELQRQLGVSYPTALRMAHVIREYMSVTDGELPLTGHVEVDETYVGGKRTGKRRRGAEGKTIVFRILERDGEMYSCVVRDASGESLISLITVQVPEGTRIGSDEWKPYRVLRALGCDHSIVSHGPKNVRAMTSM